MKKGNEGIKDIIKRDIKYLFQYERDDYYEPVRIDHFSINNYIEYEKNGDRNKTLLIEYNILIKLPHI